MGIGDRIKQIRELSGKNQRDFAALVNIGQSTLAMFENGQRKPKEIHIDQICEKIRINGELINRDWLRTGEGELTRDVDVDFGAMCADIGVNDPKAREAIEKYYELSPEDKELWWKFMEKFMK